MKPSAPLRHYSINVHTKADPVGQEHGPFLAPNSTQAMHDFIDDAKSAKKKFPERTRTKSAFMIAVKGVGPITTRADGRPWCMTRTYL